MAISVADNFSYQGSKPLDSRIKYDSVANMKAAVVDTLYDGCLAYVTTTQKYYTYDSTNETDPTTGKWRELQTGGGGTTVVPNPSGTATAELSKLQIESVIYSIVTKAVDDLTNYYTKTNTYTKTEVDTIASNIKNSRFEVVSSLPTTNIKTNVIYLVPKSTAQTNNVKDEYINLDGTTTGWELIGSTDIDLSGYVTTTALNTALANYMTTSAFNTAIADYYTKTEVDAITGDLDNLTTTAKTDLVAAINEAADPMPAEDMSEVISPLPSVYARLLKYSTEEQVVAIWTDGKPVYQKVLTGTITNQTSASTSVITNFSIGASVDKGWIVSGYAFNGSNALQALNTCDIANNKYLRCMVSNNNGGEFANMARLENHWWTSGTNTAVIVVQYTKTTD